MFVFEKNDAEHIHSCEQVLLWFYNIIYDNIYSFHVIASKDTTNFENEIDADLKFKNVFFSNLALISLNWNVFYRNVYLCKF